MPEGVGKGKGKVCFESMHLRHFTEAGGIAYGGLTVRHPAFVALSPRGITLKIFRYIKGL